MSDLLILPSTTYRPPSPQGRRRMARTLNPIMEEPEQTDIETQQHQQQQQKQEQRGHLNNLQNNNSSNWPVNQKIEQWLAPFSPLSDHFPTPRGLHFLAAPILPATPSCISSYRGPDTDADDTSSETSSSNPSSGAWNNKRSSAMTDVTEFDDLYDISDEETQRKEMLQANGIGRHMSSRRSLRRSSRASIGQRLSLSRLVIPTDIQADAKKNMTSPIPPTPPSAIAMSPAVKSLMELRQIQEIPNVSAPPSLDGSINSEEMAAMSAPPTPLIGAQDNVDEDWSGVRLQPGALETLQALSSNHESEYDEAPAPEQVIEVPQQMSQEMSQARQLPRLMTGLNRVPSGQRRSLAELSRLEIPSPGGFFSELSSATRRTWNMGSQAEEPYPYQPPTSTTAENFYKTPWQNAPNTIPPPPPRPLHLDDGPSNIVERVVEVPAGLNPEELPTAVRVEATPVTAVRMPAAETEEPTLEQIAEETFSPMVGNEIVANEIVDDYDAKYVAEQQSTSLSHIERTELWLMAQRAYLQGVVGFSDETEVPEHLKLGIEEPEAEVEVKVEEVEEKTEEPAQKAAVEAETKQKKSVRFSEITIKETVPKSLPSKLVRMENAFYRAFTDAAIKTCPSDVFVNRQPRFEAFQAQRVALKDAHRNQLLGKFQLSVVPQSAKKRMSANVARGDDVLIDDPEKLRAEKEAEARSQMNMATWHVAATKLLNGGRLICAPVAKRLARQSRFAPGADGVSRDRARILDLAGQGACDWAWHCALQYPNTKIYTVTTKTLRQLSNSNIRGPPNHRQVAVERLTKLPFSDNQFDLISARELHAVLKLFGENGADEWNACLKECMRVLKPGGYIEFSVLDADIMNAGPLGNAKAVEFGFALQTLGYDPNPTRSFMARLRRAGFDDVRRAWMCMPMGPRHSTKPPVPPPKAETPGLPPVNMTLKKDSDSAIDLSSSGGDGPKTFELEAMVSGSTDNVAAIAGIAAGWSWERWLLRAEMEKAAGELRLADMVTPGEAMREAGKMIADVHSVVEEGRNVGSGFRMLRGYARKPLTATTGTSLVQREREIRETKRQREMDNEKVGFIDMVLDTDSLA